MCKQTTREWPSRMESLVADNYTVKRFADLPVSHQMSIIWFKAVDGQAWDGVDLSPYHDLKQALYALLPRYEDLYGNVLVGMTFLDTSAIQAAVMCDPDIAETFACWEEYHSRYVLGGVPEHSQKDRWPVILSDDDEETLRDGWHRFHSYVRDGASVVPAVFFPAIPSAEMNSDAFVVRV